MDHSSDFLNEQVIADALAQGANPSHSRVEEILAKALLEKGLDLNEAAVLLSVTDPEQTERIRSAARTVKESIYGKRVVLFAPLYLSNYCVNNCEYCGFRRDNLELERRALDFPEVEQEVRLLLQQGHKRLLLVFGEHPRYANLEYMGGVIKRVYAATEGAGKSIRRVNVNCAPMDTESFRSLKSFGIGTYQCFQETYHRETYKRMHTSGPKSNYDFRVTAMHRALDAGIDDVGIGVLYGLYDHRWESLAMLMHANELDRRYGVGPHTISVPRIEPALNAPASMQPPSPMSDEDFKTTVAVLRLALPYTGMILSTRETAEMRDEVINLGISQISAGSRTNPGGYHESEVNDQYTEQFTIYDSRSLEQIVGTLAEMGLMPSMCTACYRVGRTGERFMEEAKSGHIHVYCLPNAILTFKEYLMDFGTPETRAAGEKLIAEQLQKIEEPRMRMALQEKLQRMDNGERDLYF